MIFLGVALATTLALTPYYLQRLLVGSIPVFLPELALAATVLLFFLRLLGGRFKMPRLRPGIFWLLGLFILSTTIASFIGGPNSYGALKSWVVLPSCFFLISYYFLGQTDRARSIPVWGLAVALVSVVASGFWGVAVNHDPRLMLPFNSPNAAALWLAPVIFILLDSSLPRWPRNVLAILGIGALLVTRSLGGMLAFALAGLLSAYALYYQKHEPRRLWLLFGAAIVLVLSFASLTGLFNQSLKKDGQTSFQARYEIWTTAVGIGRAHPFWGIGPNRFEDIYPKTVNGYFVDPIEWSVPQPHSLYLATWLSSGLLGLVSLLTLIGYACYLAIRRQRYFLFAALVAILVHGLVDTSYWKNDLAIVFFFLLAAVCQGDNIPVAKEGSLS